MRPWSIVFVGLSITSSWGNGHATTYRALCRELARRGHRVAFLERDVPWYASHRDLPESPHWRTLLYASAADLTRRHSALLRDADATIVGSYVPDGIEAIDRVLALARGTVAFYDIDTPVTLAALERGDCAYLAARQIAGFAAYLSFTGGPTLERIERQHGAAMACALYCSADPETHAPSERPPRWDLGYLGTYSVDRQPKVEELLLHPARAWAAGRFALAGPQYPDAGWPANLERIEHLPPAEHAGFYTAQRFTLNVTRADMAAAGWSPSVRLFEAAACGTPILSDDWPGLDRMFAPGREILPVRDRGGVLAAIRDLPEARRRSIAAAARARVLAEHTAAHRAAELEAILVEAGRRAQTESALAVSS